MDPRLIYSCAVLGRFFRDSAVYAGAGLFSSGVAFLLFPFLAHTLAPRDYGVIDIVGLATIVALLTVALEINQGLGRMVAGNADDEERRAYASTALIWSVGSYSLFAVTGLALAEPITDVLLGSQINVWVTRAAIAGIWAAGALYLVQDQFRWQGRAKAFALVSAIVALSTASATAFYVFILHARALGVVAGQLTGAVVGLGLALAMSRGIYRLQFDRSKARAMLAFSIPLVPSSIGVFLNGYADRLAIQHQQSLGSVGVYGVAFRISVFVSLLLMGVQGATTPLVIVRHADAGTPRDLARVFRLFWAMGCVAFIILSVLAEQFVRLLSAPAYFGAGRVVPFVVAAAFLAGLYVFAPGPTIAGRTRTYAAVNVTAGILNLVLAFALVPVLGIVGAGVATVVSSAAAFFATMWASQRLYPVPHDWWRLAGGALLATAAVVAGRSLLVTGRSDALAVAPLLGRLGICGLGTLAVGSVLVNRSEFRALRPRPRGRGAD